LIKKKENEAGSRSRTRNVPLRPIEITVSLGKEYSRPLLGPATMLNVKLWKKEERDEKEVKSGKKKKKRRREKRER
jgi:hypothetical protein